MGESIATLMKLGIAAILVIAMIGLGSVIFSREPEKPNQASTAPAATSQASGKKTTQELPKKTPQQQVGLFGAVFQNALLLGAIFAVAAWCGKQIIGSLQHRAEHAIIFVLSDAKDRSYGELDGEVRENPIYRKHWFLHGSIDDALASLVHKKKVKIHDRKYSLNDKNTDKEE